jgi:hypothetical protein
MQRELGEGLYSKLETDCSSTLCICGCHLLLSFALSVGAYKQRHCIHRMNIWRWRLKIRRKVLGAIE